MSTTAADLWELISALAGTMLHDFDMTTPKAQEILDAHLALHNAIERMRGEERARLARKTDLINTLTTALVACVREW